MPPSRASASSGKSATFAAVLLTTKGEVKKTNIALGEEESTLTLEALQRVFKKKELPERIGEYEHERMLLSLFGYTKGKKGTENKTLLPSPYHQQPFYGDLLVTAASLSASWEEPISLTVDQWTAFFDAAKEEEDELEDEKEDKEVDGDADEEEVEEEEEEAEEDAEEDAEEEVDEAAGLDLVADEDEEPEPVTPIKRRRAPVYNKVDTAGVKEDILPDAPPESNPLRMKCIGAFGFLLTLGFDDGQVRALEKAIFDATFQSAQIQYIPRSWQSHLFCEIYRQQLRSILCNLHPSSPVKNTRLLSRIQEGEFELAALPFMSSYEMFPEHWFMMKDKQLQREQKILEGNKSRATDQFKCRRCHKRECTYYELQTRSADEPMTIFITCLNCGKEWRQGG